MYRTLKKYSVLPGFGITLGFTLLYLSLIVLIPLSGLFLKTTQLSWAQFWHTVTEPRVLLSYRLTFGCSFLAAVCNMIFGLLVAWVLARYTFPFKKIVDAMIDLPFALPTAVAGIALTDLYTTQGWIGGLLNKAGIQVAFTPIGIFVALTFIGLPFVVRTVQPILEELDKGEEEAALCMGAGRLYTFIFVILPEILPAVLTGFALAFARALGEYGSVIFIAGNMPMKTEITTLLIVTKLEQYDVAGATAIAVVMLVISFLLLLLINFLQGWSRRRHAISEAQLSHD